MIFQNFAELFAKNDTSDDKRVVAVMAADDSHTLEAIAEAVRKGVIEAVLIGDRMKICQKLMVLDERIADYTIIDATDNEDVVLQAAELVKDGIAHFLMKGLIQTGEMMKILLSEKSGFRTSMMMSHLSLVQIPNYHKLIGITDVALSICPNLNQKRNIVKNAVAAMLRMGFEQPKVAVLAAVEQPNLKMPETLDAVELKKMNDAGVIANCIIDGPLSYDLVMSQKAAELKGIASPVCGDADLLLVPNLAAGNILLKALRYSAGAVSAGVVLGGRVPLVLTSRAAETTNKYLPILLAASASR